MRGSGWFGRAAALGLACLLVTAAQPRAAAGQDQRPAPRTDGGSGAATSRVDSLRQGMRLRPPPVIHLISQRHENSPGTTIGSPSAFGARFGDVFMGAGYQQRTRYTNIQDGSVVVGMGLGEPRRKIGLELALTSFSTVRSGFGETGGFSFKVHRLFPHLVGVAFGIENAVNWGDSDAGRSAYVVGSKVIWFGTHTRKFMRSANFSLGLGNGRFQREDDAVHGGHKVNVFGSGSLRIFGPLSVSLDWTGQDLNGGVSLVPVQKVPLAFTIGFADMTHTAGDGARLIMGLGLGFDLSRQTPERPPEDSAGQK